MTPFIDGTNIQWAWDSTSLGWLKECPRKYYYHMVRGLRSRREGVDLTFGILYHTGLETYEKQRALGRDHDEALRHSIRVALEASVDFAPEGTPKTRENLVRSIVWYSERYIEDVAKTIILADGTPAVELSFRLDLNWKPSAVHDTSPSWVLCGHIDRMVEFAGASHVLDYKTSKSSLSPYYFDQFTPHGQLSQYIYAANVLFQVPARSAIVDAAQIAVGFTEFSRGMSHRTQDQLAEWLDSTKNWMTMQVRFAETDFWPMNEMSCHKYSGCPFRPICSKSPTVRETFIETEFEVRPWNPIEART